ncbi:MAG: phage antirepressor KilAC domain-containing protein [Cetobacterium sp.]
MLLNIVEKQAPKVDYHDTVLNSDKLITSTDVAKDIGMSAMCLHRKMNNAKIIYKKSGVWKFYSDYEGCIPVYADYKITEYGQILKWTEEGRKWIIDLFERGGL